MNKLRIIAAAVVTLLILPTVINFATGGSPGPYRWLLWLLAVLCTALVAVSEIASERTRKSVRIMPRRGNNSRNTDLALAQVGRYIESRRRESLNRQVRAIIELDERPKSVLHSNHLVQRIGGTTGGTTYRIKTSTDAVKIFDAIDRSMLLLGAPGAGKTTFLLDLAEGLTAQACALQAKSPDAVVASTPVILDLAAWSRSGLLRWPFGARTDRPPREFNGWLLTELNRLYGIPEAVARTWLAEERFVLLLDGLDEVREGDREYCIKEIDALQERWRLKGLAVCSRTVDYDRLPARLHLQGAVEIQPMSQENVIEFLDSSIGRQVDIVAAISGDAELSSLLTTPLMLDVAALALSSGDARLFGPIGDPDRRRARLLDAYLVELLTRRQFQQPPGGIFHVLQSLHALALAAIRTNSGVRIFPFNSKFVVSKHVDQAIGSDFYAYKYTWFTLSGVGAASLVISWAMSSAFGSIVGLLTALPIWLLLTIGWWSSEGIGRTASFGQPIIRQFTIVLAWCASVGFLVAILIVALRWALQEYIFVESRIAVAAFIVALAVLEALAGRILIKNIGEELIISIIEEDDGALIKNIEDEVDHGMRVLLRAMYGAIAAIAISISLPGYFFGVSRAVTISWAVGTASTLVVASIYGWGGEISGIDRPTLMAILVQAGIFTAGIVILPFLVAPSRESGIWLPLLGWALGVLTGVLPGYTACILFANTFLMRVVFVSTGEPWAWNQRILRFSVSQGLLISVNGEFRFTHLLLRDYLANFTPQIVAQDVQRRVVEVSN
jgi:hypothetical protein